MVLTVRKTLAASALASVLVVSMGCSEQPLAPSPTSEPSGATTNTTATTGAGGAGGGSSITRPKHVLIVIADDLGVDQVLAYNDENNDGVADGMRPIAKTPRIDALCQQGVRFERAWSAPTCSPTRATILTGRYGFRTGVGWAVAKDNQLKLSEVTLPETLSEWGVSHANIGKWHLGVSPANGGQRAPNEAGWGHYAGSLDGTLADYASWERTVDGILTKSEQYATSANVDDAIAWLNATSADEPWLLWLAFNAPHTPYHLPPLNLHDANDLDPNKAKSNPGPYYRATVQALDHELGRLLDWMDDNGHGPVDVIFLGDNGSPARVVEAPWTKEHAKGSLYQGGVHVPLCIAGPSVSQPSRTEPSLVDTVDLFALALELFDVPLTSIEGDVTRDAQPLLAILGGDTATARTWSYTGSFGNPNAGGGTRGQAIRNDRFKLIVFEDQTEELFDLKNDKHETNNLLSASLNADAQIAYDDLMKQLNTLRSSP